MRRIEQNNLRKLKINRLNLIIPLIAFVGLGVIGTMLIGQDIDDGAFALSETTNVSVDNTTYSIGVSTVGDSVDIDAEATSTGVYTAKKDTVTVTTNIPGGYSLYISAGSSDPKLYLDGDSSASYIDATSGTYSSPQVLRTNTYGYAVPSTINGAVDNNFDDSYSTPNPTSTSKWAALPINSSQQLIQTTNNANTEGEEVDVYYGLYLNNAVTAGAYIGSVTYTAMAEASNSAAQPTSDVTMNPTSGTVGEATKLMIVTNLHTLASVGTVTVSMSGTSAGATSSASCGGVTADTSTGVLIITCNTPTDLAVGTYTVTANVPTYGKTYTVAGGFEVVKRATVEDTTGLGDITYMQDATSSICSHTGRYAAGGGQFTLKDSRDNNEYVIRRLNDGNCWMVQNLRLTKTTLQAAGHSATLTSSDTALTGSFTVPNNTTWTSTSETYNGIVGAEIAPIGSTTGSPAADDVARERGAYYTFAAAVASTANFRSSAVAGSSICPKGWELPDSSLNGNISTSDPQVETLRQNYSNVSTFMTAFNYGTTADVRYAGSYNPGSSYRYIYGSGTVAYYRSKRGYPLAGGSYDSSTPMAWFTSSEMTVGAGSKYSGYSVRCFVRAL